MRAIFISYRRDDAEGQAGRLFDDLSAQFGPSAVFMDVAGIEPGRDFRRVIDEHVSSCGVLLAVIGRGWIDAKDETGRRRLEDPLDFVRLETASALKRDIPVIPVLVHGATMPRAEQLPDDLKELAYRNGVELTHARWDSDVQILIKALRPHVGETNVGGDGSAGPKPRPKRGRDGPDPAPVIPHEAAKSSIPIIAAAVVALAVAIGGFVAYQKSGNKPPQETKVVEPETPRADKTTEEEADSTGKAELLTKHPVTKGLIDKKTAQAMDALEAKIAAAETAAALRARKLEAEQARKIEAEQAKKAEEVKTKLASTMGNVLSSWAETEKAKLAQKEENNSPASEIDQMTQWEREDMGVRPTRELHGGAMHGPTPNQIPGGRLITTQGLVQMLQNSGQKPIIFDALGSGEQLPNAIPAAAAAQAGSFDDLIQQTLGQMLGMLTHGNRATPLVFYCQGPNCWMSYNASLRAINLGYTNVLWYRGGLEAWQRAGLPLNGAMNGNTIQSIGR